MLATLTAAMLDQGTANQDRFQIAEKLDRLGANLSFSSGDQSLNFSGNSSVPMPALFFKFLRTSYVIQPSKPKYSRL